MTEPLSFAGLSLDRPRIMGVINVTPDSLFDGGETLDARSAIARGFAMIDDGVDIIDIGGESTRPGAEAVPVEEQLKRVLPVVEALATAGVKVSIDTRRAEVMTAAIDAGATIINDITALLGDPHSIEVVARRGVSVILMHMQGDPTTMQLAPCYNDVVEEVATWLRSRVEACVAQGIPRGSIAIDPGIGFGKTVEQNLAILRSLRVYEDFECGILVGMSRKSFIAKLSRGETPRDRLPGSLAAALASVQSGAHIIRVHDVAETQQALSIWKALGFGSSSASTVGRSAREFI